MYMLFMFVYGTTRKVLMRELLTRKVLILKNWLEWS